MTHSGPPGVTDNDFLDDDFEEKVEPEAEGLAAGSLWAFALLMLCLAPYATREAPQDKGWFQEPIVWPLVVLLCAIASGAPQVLRFVRLRRLEGFGARSLTAFDGMGRSLIYAVSFCVYLLGISSLGFTIATAVYLQFLFWTSGLRGGKWPLVALLVAIAIVAVFRVGLGIWFPLPPVMSLFPDWIGNALGEYL